MQKENGRAAVWTARRRLEIMEFKVPTAAEDGMVLKVDAAAICGTDGHLFPQDPPYPSILGHEFTGTIVDMGSKANKKINIFGGPVKVGDRVALYPWITCGKCSGCLTYGSGTCTVCEDSFVYGIPYEKTGLTGIAGISSDVNIYPHFKGGFAEYAYVYPETYLWKLPDDMPSEVAALLDPLAVAVRAIELSLTCPGVIEEAFNTNSTVVIIGVGPVGILAALVARLMGVERVIVLDNRDKRLSKAVEFAHVDTALNINGMTAEDRINAVKNLTGGKGADVVLQCANTPSAFIEAIEMVRRMGTVVEIGNMVNVGSSVQIDPARHICGKHIRIMGMSANNPGAFDKAFHLLKRHKDIDFTKLYSHTCDLDGLEKTLNSITDPDYIKGLVKFK